MLSHSLLDLLSPATIVQKIATNGANAIYPSHTKKTPSVLMYTELKIVTVLSYFIFVYIMNCSFNTVLKFDFVKKWYAIGHCVILYYST
jgi:hypothetical protein